MRSGAKKWQPKYNRQCPLSGEAYHLITSAVLCTLVTSVFNSFWGNYQLLGVLLSCSMMILPGSRAATMSQLNNYSPKRKENRQLF